MNTIKKQLLISLCALFCYACAEVDPKDCEMAVCSGQETAVYLQVRDTLQHPVALDSFKLINMLDQSPVILPRIDSAALQEMRNSGNYLFLNDSFVKGHENTRVIIEFTGIFKQKALFKHAVTFDTDCCHVSPVYGELKVVVDTLLIR
jgi:hypothetical protein